MVAKKLTFILSLLAVLVLLLSFACAPRAPVEDPADFFKGRTLELVCAYKAGGGNDAWARRMAPVMSKYTGASVIVRNMDGGEGLAATNYTYNNAPKDGTTIAFITIADLTLKKLLKQEEGVSFDMNKLEWLGRISLDIPSAVVRSEYKTVADIRAAKDFKGGVQSPWGMGGIKMAVFFEVLGLTNARIVTGYESDSQRTLGLIRGDIDSYTPSIASGQLLIKQETAIRMMMALAKKRSPAAPDLPTIYELTNVTKEGERWLEIMEAGEAGRAVFAPPGIPAERLKFLRDAFAKTAVDKEFLDTCEKAKAEVLYVSGEELGKTMTTGLNLTDKETNDLIYLISKKYIK